MLSILEMSDPESTEFLPLQHSRKSWGMWFLGFAAVLTGFHQWHYWPLGQLSNPAPTVFVIFALALMSTKSQVAALLFVPAVAQLVLYAWMVDGHTGDDMGPIVGLMTMVMSAIFVFAVGSLERHASRP